mmetsp:Transcript_10177/g.25027  ORF Transcript_10177/g.25027 Transcript_10177/m.25027 type:complete len:108 (-) Transcript_10177:1338-1661(-)
MRFLSVQPLTSLADPSLMQLFNDCPNRYLLTVLGWVYPKAVYDGVLKREAFVVPYESTAANSKQLRIRNEIGGGADQEQLKRQKQSTGGTSVILDSAQNERVSGPLV